MPEIRRLPPGVVNKIAAGEVIERPASVVKELMENSIDAGAARVDVSVERGGGELVRVSDDGRGIPAEQLRLAAASHATSKIADADDLFRVETLGFRGEALASIAEVSQFRLRSRTNSSAGGAELEIVGGDVRDESPCGCPVGTTVEVRDLFFNTPVRRKFLRTTQTEMGHVSEAFTRIALAWPRVHFTLRHNERVVHELPPAEGWRERIAALFGSDLADSLIRVEGGDEQMQLRGDVAHPDFNRANNRMQYLFLNGRHIRDRSLQHALHEAYRGLLLTGRYPIAFLRLELPPRLVDVNVHPTKLEVRFQDGGRVYSRLLGVIRNRFLSTDLTAQARMASETEAPRGPGDGASPTAEGASAPHHGVEPSARDLPRGPARWAVDPRGLAISRLEESAAPSVARGEPGAPPAPDRAPARGVAPPGREIQRDAAPARGLQMHNRYLVAENEEGFVVIDQHALHERILYERLREKVLRGGVESQRLLVPEPVSLTPAEAGAAIDVQEALGRLGIQIEPFGGDTVLISAYPAMLANVSPADMLRQVVDQLLTGGKPPDRRDLLDRLLHTVSCKAAVKAGDRLSPEEVAALLDQRHLCQDSHHCPHGRPTALIFTNAELDRRFLRT